MIIRTMLEYRGYEEREYNFSGRHGVTRLASFLDPFDLQVYKFDVSENYAAEFKAMELEVRKEYEVTLTMNAQPQITNEKENNFGRDRFVLSNRNFICRFEITDIIPFSNTILPKTDNQPDGKKGGKA